MPEIDQDEAKRRHDEGMRMRYATAIPPHLQEEYIRQTFGEDPLCVSCEHYFSGTKCAAYPGGIPREIIALKEIEHRGPYPGDGGLRYKPKAGTIVPPAPTKVEPSLRKPLSEGGVTLDPPHEFGYGTGLFSSVCTHCAHLMDPSSLSCHAFPFMEDKWIPRDIWLGKNPHTSPYPGDGGIRFTPRITAPENR